MDFDSDESDDGIVLTYDRTPFIPTRTSGVQYQSVELLVVNLDCSSAKTPLQQMQEVFAESRSSDGYQIPPNVKLVESSNLKSDFVRIIGGTIGQLTETKDFLISKGFDVSWSPGTGEDKSRTISVSLPNLWSSEKDNPKLEADFNKAIQEVVGKDVRILSFSVAFDFSGVARAYIGINCRKAISTLVKNKLLIRSTKVKVYPPKVIIPRHPYQLVVSSPELPHQDQLDEYTGEKYGLRESDMINDSTYTFIIFGGWDNVRKAIKEWDPSEKGYVSLPKPQLLYHFNTFKKSRTEHEVRAAMVERMAAGITRLTSMMAEFKAKQLAAQAEMYREWLEYRRNSTEEMQKTLENLVNIFLEGTTMTRTNSQNFHKSLIASQRESTCISLLNLQIYNHLMQINLLCSDLQNAFSRGNEEDAHSYKLKIEAKQKEIEQISERISIIVNNLGLVPSITPPTDRMSVQADIDYTEGGEIEETLSGSQDGKMLR